MLPLLRCLRRARPGVRLHFAGVREFAAPFAAAGVVDAVVSSEDLVLWDPDRARERLRPFAEIIGDVPAVAHTVFDPRALVSGVPAGRQLARQVGFEPEWPDDAWLTPAGGDGGGDGGGDVAARTFLAPGSGGRAKCLPREHWLELAAGLRPVACTVIIGPVERERDDPRRWPWPAGTEFFVDGTVLQLAAALRGARAYYGHDSGPTHLAAMLGVATTAFFVSTDPTVWAPVGAHVQVRGPQDFAGRMRP